MSRLDFYVPHGIRVPEPKPLPRCPVCNGEARDFYIGYWNGIIGCDECVTIKDAEEYEEENRRDG